MTRRKTQFTEPEFRSALKREIGDLLEGRATYNRSLAWLYEVRVGLTTLPDTRLSSIAGAMKLLMFSVRAEASQKAAPCEAKPLSANNSHASHTSHRSHLKPKGV
jgi:hypothetical protein